MPLFRQCAEMGQITWYKRYPEDALSGMMGLSLEERGAYNSVLDLIYTRDGKLPDDDRFIAGWLGCDVRVWKRIRGRLIDLEKLYSVGGFLRNRRADEEVLTALSRVGSARDAGKASARSRAHKSKRKDKENNGDAATGVGTGDATGVSTNQSLEPDITPLPPGKSEEDYAFIGKVIRLDHADHDRWRSTYHAIPDFAAELAALDEWLVDRPEKQARWFQLVSGSLNRKHQEFLANRNAGPTLIPSKFETPEDRLKRERAEYVDRVYGPNSPKAKRAGGAG